MRTITLYIIIACCCFSCKKYLDLQPKGKLIPTSVEDFRMLLDNTSAMNMSGGLADFATDDFTITDAMYNQLFTNSEKQTYIWASNIYDLTEQGTDWSVPSKHIYNANLVLEGLDADRNGNPAQKAILKGEALFFRANAVFSMASMYAAAYDPQTAGSKPGVPYRTSSDVFVISQRPALQATYDQLIADLTASLPLLPPKAAHLTRPSREAAHMLLARIFLDMGRFPDARDQAIKALEIDQRLLDYNQISPTANPKFQLFNDEYVFFTFSYYDFSFLYFATIHRSLYDLYESNDLRKTLFYRTAGTGNAQTYTFTGSYAPAPYNFSGMARDEVYLIAAETCARTDQPEQARTYLNTLLRNRYQTAGFTPVNLGGDALLKRILEERRKELVFRNRRWSDLKRLNREPLLALTLTRTVAGETFTLPPGDARYVFPIPFPVINATGMAQNER